MGPHEVEIDKVKRSRFIGLAAPCDSPESARAFVEAARARFHDARHHAFAWRVGAATRASDDGEPHHSAGAPILREIEGRGLGDVVVVVVRYYGGVKLGTGGLARAYGAAAAAVLRESEVRHVAVRTPMRVSFGYPVSGAVQRVLRALGLQPVSADYAAEVSLLLHLEADRVQGVLDQLRDATGGSARCEVMPPVSVTADPPGG